MGATFGEWARGTAIQFDLFTSSPLLLIAGILIARHYRHGEMGSDENPLITLLKAPPTWTAMAAVVLNATGVQMVPPVADFLDTLGHCVVTLMLISLGMRLRWHALRLTRIPVMGMVICDCYGLDAAMFAAKVALSTLLSMVTLPF